MNPKIVFIQVEESEEARVADLLCRIESSDYLFVILPVNSKLLTKEEVLKLMLPIVKD